MRTAICLTVMLLASAPASAQLIPPPAIPDSGRASDHQIGAIRLASSSGGFIWGAVLGGYVGHQLLANNECRNCASPHTNSLIIGASIGGSLGAAFGASFLNLSSVCSYKHRLLRSLVGAGIGGGSAFVLSGGLEHEAHSAFFVPLGAVGGALGTLGHCWRSRS